MARNGSGVYSLPAGYLAIDGQTIQSSQHNTPLEDLAADANAPRPISAGGTGAATAAAARAALFGADQLAQADGGTGATTMAGASITPTGATTADTLGDHLARTVWVEDFGAVGSPIGTATTSIADSTAAFQAAVTAAGVGGRVLYQPKWYRLTDTITLLEGQTLECVGSVSDWENADFFSGTLIFDGTGPKDHSFKIAIGAQAESGGSVANPAAALSYLDNSGTRGDVFTLYDFTEGDASGATPATAKAFSACIKMARYSRLVNVVVTHDKSGDLANHMTIDGNLGDEWDVGVLAFNADNWTHQNVRVAGNFRIAGFLLVSAWDDDPDTGFNGIPIANQGTSFNSRYQGHVGFMARAADVYRVTATNAAYIEIAWSASHMWPASGTFAKAAAGATLHNYTSITASGDKLRLNTATDLSGSYSVGDIIKDGRDNDNYGFDGTRFIAGRFLSSIARAHMLTDSLYLQTPGACVELSGFPLRGFDFIGCTLDTREDRMVHMHQVSDVFWTACYFEGKGSSRSDTSAAIPAGAFWIGRRPGANASTYPAGGTGDVRFTACEWADRTITRAGAYTQASDVSNRHNTAGGTLFDPDPLSDDIRRIYGSKTFGDALRFRGGVLAFTDNDANALRWQINASGHLVPGADGTYDIGSSTLRPEQVFTEKLTLRPYTVATAPDPTTLTNSLIYVTDGDSGARCIAFSNGSSWLRVPFGAAIASS